MTKPESRHQNPRPLSLPVRLGAVGLLALGSLLGLRAPLRAGEPLSADAYWSRPLPAPASQVCSGDVDGDDQGEILIAGSEGEITLLEADGTTAWQVDLSESVGAALLADLDRDGKLEALIGSERGVTTLDSAGQTRWFYRTAYAVQALAVGQSAKELAPSVYAATGYEHAYLLTFEGKMVWHYTPASQGFGGTVTGLAAGDVDDDGKSEVALGFDFPGYKLLPPSGHILILDHDGSEVHRRRETSAVVSITTVDVDGWGKRLIAAGTAAGDLLVLFGEGAVRWQRNLGSAIVQVLGADVDDDGRHEVTAVAEDSILTLNEDGSDLWQLDPPLHAVGAGYGEVEGSAGRLLAVLTWQSTLHKATAELLDMRGQRVESYLLPRAVEDGVESKGQWVCLTDLNRDGWSELLVANSESVYLLARARGAAQTRLAWRLRARDSISGLISYNGGASGTRVLLSSEDGNLYVLDQDGSLAWRHTSEGLTHSLSSGDLDGDGIEELLLAYNAPAERGDAFRSGLMALRQDGRVMWSSPVTQYVRSVSAVEIDESPPSEVLGVTAGGWIGVVSGAGQPLWSTRSAGSMPLVVPMDLEGDGRDELCVGTDDGWLRLLSPAGQPMWEFNLGGGPVRAVAGADTNGDGRLELLAASLDGQVVALDSAGAELWRYDLPEEPLGPLSSGGNPAAAGGLLWGDFEGPGKSGWVCATAAGTLVGISSTGSYRWSYTVRSRLLAVGSGDVDGDGRDEIVAASTDGVLYLLADYGVLLARHNLGSAATALLVSDIDDDGRDDLLAGTSAGEVQVYVHAPNRPPLVSNPAVVQTEAGYVYSATVLDPENDRVEVNLRVRDPFSGAWSLAGTRYALSNSTLYWFVEPFPLLASGRLASYSFSYSDGPNAGTLGVISGPRVPGFPWYIYGGALALVGLALYAYRIWHVSPLRNARRIYAELASNPAALPSTLRSMAAPASTERLIRLSRRAREAGDKQVASLAEGYLLLSSRPEAGLEVILAALQDLGHNRSSRDPQLTALIGFYELLAALLEANTLGRILMLRPRLSRFLRGGEMPVGDVQVVLPEQRAALLGLQRVIELLGASESAETADDKLTNLAQAAQALAAIQPTSFALPEGPVLERIIAGWQKVVGLQREEWQGRAQLRCRLRTRRIVAGLEAHLQLDVQNRGRYPAQRTTVDLAADTADYTPLDPPVVLGDVAPGQTRQVELRLKPAGLEGFRVEFVLRYSDQESRDQSQLFADRVEVLEPSAFQTIPNPYVPGRPLGPASPVFYGRDDVYDFVAENARGLLQRNILILIGQRRTGKTSMLLQLPLRLDSSIIPVYLDCQSLGLTPGLANWLSDVAATIGDALAERGIQVNVPTPDALREQPARAFEQRFLRDVETALGERTLLWVLDEFEELETRVRSGRLEPTLFPYLRHLMQHTHKLAFAFVGTHRLEEMSRDYWSVLFNIALYHRIGYLDEEAAIRLATEPVRPYGMVYDDLALNRIWQVTAGHPYFLQLLCYALVNAHNCSGRSYTTVADVDGVLEEILTLGSAHFAFLWESSSGDERAALLALTQLLGRLGQPRWPVAGATPGDVMTLLSERGLNLEHAAVAAALRSLTDREILSEVSSEGSDAGAAGERYVFRVGLVALWVERFKSLSRVIEEMARK